MKTKLEYFQEHADWLKKNNLATDLVLVENHLGDWGFICEDDCAEELDNHCNQCQEDQPLYFRFCKDKEFPYHCLMAVVGPTKFEKIVMGEFKLEHVKILNEKL